MEKVEEVLSRGWDAPRGNVEAIQANMEKTRDLLACLWRGYGNLGGSWGKASPLQNHTSSSSTTTSRKQNDGISVSLIQWSVTRRA